MKKSLLFAFILLTLFACGNKEKEEEVKIGKYVYMDNDSTIHINTKCLKFIIGEEFMWDCFELLQVTETQTEMRYHQS